MIATQTLHNLTCECGTNISLMPGQASAYCKKDGERFDLELLPAYNSTATIQGYPYTPKPFRSNW